MVSNIFLPKILSNNINIITQSKSLAIPYVLLNVLTLKLIHIHSYQFPLILY